MYSPEGTVLIQSAWNFVRMLILIKSRPGSQLGHVGSKTRSLGQILEKPVYTLDGPDDPTFVKLCQNVNSYKM